MTQGPDIGRPKLRSFMKLGPTLKMEQSLSLAAFVMSLTITLINAYYALQGAEIAANAPRQLVIYRDGDGPNSVLSFAMRSDLINLSDGYGDVMKDARLSLTASEATLEYQGTLTSVFSADAPQRARECELGARCLALPGLLLIERSDQIIDLPGGAARALTLSFPAVGWNCTGPPEACRGFGDFPQSVRALGAGPLSVTMRLRFHTDGERRIHCRTAKFDAAYLMKVGWISLPCEMRSVAGGAAF